LQNNFNQMHEREVYDIIYDLWRSFKFLHEKRLLCSESLEIG
jgi:hypothetical protein